VIDGGVFAAVVTVMYPAFVFVLDPPGPVTVSETV
jgi:hypothetical protein